MVPTIAVTDKQRAGHASPQFANVAAILVLYSRDVNPDAALSAVRAVVGQVVLVDNAPDGHPASTRWQGERGVAVVGNANRGGLAGAYNAARQWLRQHAPSVQLVTFIDDDSDVTVLGRFLADPGVRDLLERADTAAVAPAHRDRATGMRAKHLQLSRWRWRQLPREQRGVTHVSFVINSMSVWRTDALERIGAHNEWLGVDHVDTEYCMRAAELGLRVYLHADHEFAQSIGRRRAYRMFRHTLQSGGHGPARRHSIGRTTAWLALRSAWRQPAFAALCLARIAYEALGVLVTENERKAKLGALVAGAFQGIAEAVRVWMRTGMSATRRVWSLVKRFGPRERERRRLANQYLRGEGIEIGALHNPLRTQASVRYVDRLSRADLRRHYPELAAFPVVEPDIVDDGERLTKIANGSQDFIIANHFIEHCEDPIGTLKAFASKLRPGGTIYMAVPDKRFTFDRARASTTLAHLEIDHCDGGASSRQDHYLEYARLASAPTPLADEAAKPLAAKLMADQYSIHFHVWTHGEFADFVRACIARHLAHVTLVDQAANRDEGIFILKSR